MTDEIDRDDDEALAAEYVLGLLTPDEARAFEERMAFDPDLRMAYARWAGHFTGMADEIAPVAPPAALKARIDAELHPTPARSGRSRTIWGVLAGLAAIVAIVIAVQLRTPQGPAFAPGYSAEIAAADRSLVIEAAYDAGTGQLRLDRTTGGAAAGRALELWLIAGSNPPVSLGVLPASSTAAIDVPADLREAFAGGTLAVSDEPPGGSPTGAPTGRVLAAGPITVL